MRNTFKAGGRWLVGRSMAVHRAVHESLMIMQTILCTNTTRRVIDSNAKIQLKPDEHCMWPLKDYSEMEAREAYERVANFHGWPTQRRHA